MGIGLSGGALAAVILAGMLIWGGHAVARKIAHPARKAAQVITQPIRHPIKDLKRLYKIPHQL